MGNQLGDETEFVRGTPGVLPRNKKGDFVATLGKTAGAPGLRIVVEVKDQPLKLKAAIDELQEAKQNREAAVGIFVFARGSEPPEVGDFRKIGEDFFCTVDKNSLAKDTPLTCFESAYKIARALAVESARKEATGELDLQKVHDHLGALEAWADRIADMATASTPEKRDHFRGRTAFSDGEAANEYSLNVQIAELNALHAALAVIKWKKLCGYYDDVSKEHYCAYTIRSNQLISEDAHEI